MAHALAGEAENLVGGFAAAVTGGLLGGGNTCSTGYQLGHDLSWGAWLIPEDWGLRLFGGFRSVFPKTVDLIVKLQANRRVTEPTNTKMVIATLERLKELFR